MPVTISIDFPKGEDFQRDLERAVRKMPGRVKSAHVQIGQRVEKRAKDYAPISPTKGQIEANLVRGAFKRRARVDIQFNPGGTISIRDTTLKSKRRPTPGALTKGIAVMKVRADLVMIGVPLNFTRHSRYYYAGKIHDERYKPGGWTERGLGTKAKGPQAREKFILRAINDSNSDIVKLYERALEKIKRDLER